MKPGNCMVESDYNPYYKCCENFLLIYLWVKGLNPFDVIPSHDLSTCILIGRVSAHATHTVA